MFAIVALAEGRLFAVLGTGSVWSGPTLGDQDFAQSGLLPSGDSGLAPWPGTWFAAAPEPSVIVIRASVSDNGLTATRPYVVRLLPKSIIK